MTDATDAEAIWRAIHDSNAAWMAGRPDDVAKLFADDAVMVAPGLRARVEGRDAIVRSFAEYCASVTTEEFRELEHSVDVRGDTAVAAYRFSVRYVLDGKRFDEEGEEILVFARLRGRWLAVWRTQVPLAGPPG